MFLFLHVAKPAFGVPVVNPSELTDEVKALMQERTKDNEDNGGRSGLVQAP